MEQKVINCPHCGKNISQLKFRHEFRRKASDKMPEIPNGRAIKP